MSCLPEYSVTLGPSLFVAPSGPPTVGLPSGPFEVEQYQKVANGSYGEATIYLCDYTADLKLLLDQHIEIKNTEGEICYCGYIEEVYRCCGEYVAWGWSTATLYNRIAVTWSENSVMQLSDWQENTVSMQTHGVRELVLPLPAGSLYTPAQYATRLLQELGTARPILHNTYKCRCNVTYLKVRGYLNTLSWQSYSHSCGLADTDASFAHLQPLGLGFISDQMGIHHTTDDDSSQVGIVSDQLLAFEIGDTIIMSGWGQAQNNLTTTISDFIKDDFESVTSDGISTRFPNRIHDNNTGLIEFHPLEFIQVSGSALSTHSSGGIDGTYWVENEDDGHNLGIFDQGFGDADYYDVPVTITQCITIDVPEILASEDPGALVTVRTQHQYLCQRICNDCSDGSASSPTSSPWSVSRVQIAVNKAGSPTATLALSLGPDCFAVNAQATATIDAASVTTTMRYVEAELDTPISLAAGACLYVQIHPIGPLGELADPSTTDYYNFGGGLAQNNVDRALTSADGVSFSATAYTTAIRLLEYQSITEQLFDLVTLGNLITSVAVLDQLAFAVPTYRADYTSLLYVIEQLITMGDPAGQRLQLLLDCDGGAVIRTEPTVDEETPVTLDCCSCPDQALCTLEAGHWLRAPRAPASGREADLTDVPAVFLDSFYVSYKQCRARFIDRDFSRTAFAQSLRYPGLF